MNAVDPSILRWILYHSKCGMLSVVLAKLQEDPNPDPAAASFQPKFPIDLYQVLDGIQARYLVAALKQAQGNTTHAAELCKLKRSTFNAQMRRLGLRDRRGNGLYQWAEADSRLLHQ